MGEISTRVGIPFYRSQEAFEALAQLKIAGWDIEQDILSFDGSSIIFKPCELLKKLYSKINAIVAEEDMLASALLNDLEIRIGEINIDNILNAYGEIGDLYSTFNSYGIPYDTKLKIKFDGVPIEKATSIMNIVDRIVEAINNPVRIEKLHLYSSGLTGRLREFVNDINDVENVAFVEKDSSAKELIKIGDIVDSEPLARAGKEQLGVLYDRVEHMEVSDVI